MEDNVGIGLADEMIKSQIDEFGEYYPPYGFFNDDDFFLIQPKDCKKILYGIKASSSLNSKIHGNVYSKINSSEIVFLISELEAKTALLASPIGQKMSSYQKIQRLMPHEMTSRLHDEMANLRLKRTGNQNDIVLEQINARYPKDKYSSFAYGLWRIKEIEEEWQKRHRRGLIGGKRKLMFFN